MTKFAGRPARRAFDLVAPAEDLRAAADGAAIRRREGAATAFDELAAETLMAIARAVAPTLEEVIEMAARAGIGGETAVLLRDPRIAALVAERFPYRSPDAAAVRAYYDGNRHEFRTPDLFEGREILIGGNPADRDWRIEAYGRAERIVAMLQYNRRVFKDLLIYSAAPSREHGGRIGPVARGGWKSEVAAPFFSLNSGEVFPLPVPSSLGFHVLAMDRIEPGRLHPFAAVESEVVRLLVARSRLAAARRHLAGLDRMPPRSGCSDRALCPDS